MSKTETQAKTPIACRCQLGWAGTADAGSTVKHAEDYTHPCDKVTTKSFAQGHDARMSSRLATEIALGQTSRQVAEQIIRMAGGTELLISKTMRSADLRAAKLAAKPAKAQAKQESAQVATRALAEQIARGKAKDDEAEAISRVRATVREVPPVVNPDDQEDGPGDNLHQVDDDVRVNHGKRTYPAKVVDLGEGLLVAQHNMNGRTCHHDLDTDEVIVPDDKNEDIPPF